MVRTVPLFFPRRVNPLQRQTPNRNDPTQAFTSKKQVYSAFRKKPLETVCGKDGMLAEKGRGSIICRRYVLRNYITCRIFEQVFPRGICDTFIKSR
jgi:hypothetical protein